MKKYVGRRSLTLGGTSCRVILFVFPLREVVVSLTPALERTPLPDLLSCPCVLAVYR